MRYNTPNTPLNGLRDFVTRGGIPVTITLLSISVALFLAMFFTSETVTPFLEMNVAFSPGMALRTPWTLLTYHRSMREQGFRASSLARLLAFLP